MNRIRTPLLAAALALAATAPAAAQVPLTPRALGMGGAYLGAARGHEALFLNPANLGLSGNPYWSVTLPQVALGLTMVGPTFEDLPDIANYDDISDERKAEILATIPQEGTEAAFEARLPFFVMQSGRFSLGVGYGAVGSHTMSRDLVDLLLNGYDQNNTSYKVDQTYGERATFFDIAAGYGRAFGPLSLGVTAHYYHGTSLVRSRMFEPRYDLERRDLQVDYFGVRSTKGTGYGVDVGAALEPLPGLTLSAAVANLASDMTWDDELVYRSLTLTRADFDAANAKDLMDRYKLSEQALDPSGAPAAAYQAAQGIFEEAYFPATLRAGANWALPTRTNLGVMYQENLGDGRLGPSWDRMVGVGLQQKLPLITVRAGYSTNLESGLAKGEALTAGLSLGVLELGLGKYTNGDFGSGAREGWIASFGVGVRTKATR